MNILQKNIEISKQAYALEHRVRRCLPTSNDKAGYIAMLNYIIHLVSMEGLSEQGCKYTEALLKAIDDNIGRIH